MNKFVVPNTEKIARELAVNSQMMVVIKRVLGLPLGSKLELVKSNFRYVFGLLNRDYSLGIRLLMEIEILMNRADLRKKQKLIFHNQILDMCLAVKNKMLINYFFGLTNKYNLTPVLATANGEMLVRMLSVVDYPDNLRVLPTGKEFSEKTKEVLKSAGIKIEKNEKF